MDDVEPRALSEQQKKSLYETGTFIVNSKKYSIPYKWLVHSMLYVGTEERRRVYLSILGAAFGQIIDIKENIYGNGSSSFRYVWGSIKNAFWDIVDLFIGKPFWRTYFSRQPLRVL